MSLCKRQNDSLVEVNFVGKKIESTRVCAIQFQTHVGVDSKYGGDDPEIPSMDDLWYCLSEATTAGIVEYKV